MKARAAADTQAVAAEPRRPVRIAVIIPAGPGDDLLDTVASVVRYTGPSRVILVVDDTSGRTNTGCRVRSISPDIAVIPAPSGAQGGYGGLWVKLAAGYRWVLDTFAPQMILRLDADALVLGAGLEAAVEQAFSRDPGVGLLGSYLLGPDGGTRDFTPAARALRGEAGLPGYLHLRRRSSFRSYLALARKAGYTDGEHALGGAYIHSFAAANSLYRRGWLNQPWLATSKVGEDNIMALLTRAAGYRIADFGGPADPLALQWRGLPAHPADLLAQGKLVTHSVRSWNGLTEREIRAIFAAARASSVPGYRRLCRACTT